MLAKEQANFQKNGSPKLGDTLEPRLWLGNFFDLYNTIPEKSVNLFLSDLPFGKFKLSYDPAINLTDLEQALDYLLDDRGQIVLYVDFQLMNTILSTFTRFVMRTFFVLRMSTSMPINKFSPLPNLQFVLVMRRTESKVSELCWNPYEMLPKGEPYFKRSNILQSDTRRMTKSPILQNESGLRWITQVLDSSSKCNLPESERRGIKHPFQKSVETLRGFIRTFSNKGELIVDGFMGSASTLVASFLEDRRSIGFEIDANLFDEAKRRILDVTAQKTLFHAECMACL